jgi:hypothetical protein
MAHKQSGKGNGAFPKQVLLLPDLDQAKSAVLLGHVSIETTERYLGCKQRIQSAVNDRIGIEPAA